MELIGLIGCCLADAPEDCGKVIKYLSVCTADDSIAEGLQNSRPRLVLVDPS